MARKPKAKPKGDAASADSISRSEWLLQQRKTMRITAALLGAFALIIYLLTLWPAVPGGDSGELISVACTLGIAHPPGYPLFSLLGALFTLIPYGSIAWRVNLLSALCDAAAAALLFLTVARWSRSLAAGIVAAGLYAFSPLIWTWATQAEVFSLNNLFVVSLLYIALVYTETRSRRLLLLAAFLFGLGLSNHQTLLFVGAPIGIWMVAISPRALLAPRPLLQVALCFLSGLLLYLYLPLAALRHPGEQWGDPTSLDGFLTHILRREYGTLQLGANNDHPQFWNALGLYFAWLPGELLHAGALLAAVGFYQALRSKADAGFGRLTCFSWAFYIVVFNSLANLPIQDRVNLGVFTRFWQQANIFVFAWAGLGFAEIYLYISTRVQNIFTRAGKPERIPLVLAAGLVFVQLGVHYRGEDQHRNHLFQQFGESILGSLPRKALLLSRGDIYTNTTSYLQLCEQMRPDVTVLDRELLKTGWRRKQLEVLAPGVALPRGVYRFHSDETSYNLGELLRANIDRRPAFICNMDPEEDQSWQVELQSWPYGLINEVVRNDGQFDVHRYAQEGNDLLSGFDLGALPPRDQLIAWDLFIWNEYWEADHRKGRRLMSYAIDHGNDPVLLRDSTELMEKLLARHPAPPAQLFKNLGYAYSRLVATDPSASAKEAKAWRRYLQMAEGEKEHPDPDLPVIRRSIEGIPLPK